MMTPAEIKLMTAPERPAPIGELWDIVTDAETLLPTTQYHELERRLASFDADRPHGISWANLKGMLIKSTS